MNAPANKLRSPTVGHAGRQRQFQITYISFRSALPPLLRALALVGIAVVVVGPRKVLAGNLDRAKLDGDTRS